MAPDALSTLATLVGARLSERRLMLATAESCTGGGVAAAVTGISGSSAWFERGFVTYSNESKQESLGVDATTIEKHGAVSEPVAREMAQGALGHSRAQVSVAITGVAGPTGGTHEKPVGTVCFAWAGPSGETASATRKFPGDREQIRRQSVLAALQGVLERLEQMR
jgi:nicotinamide-nucleotide amidase